MEKLLTTAEAAEFLRIKPQTLKLKRMKKQGPVYLKVADSGSRPRILYRMEDLKAYVGLTDKNSTTNNKD